MISYKEFAWFTLVLMKTGSDLCIYCFLPCEEEYSTHTHIYVRCICVCIYMYDFLYIISRLGAGVHIPTQLPGSQHVGRDTRPRESGAEADVPPASSSGTDGTPGRTSWKPAPSVNSCTRNLKSHRAVKKSAAFFLFSLAQLHRKPLFCEAQGACQE